MVEIEHVLLAKDATDLQYPTDSCGRLVTQRRAWLAAQSRVGPSRRWAPAPRTPLAHFLTPSCQFSRKTPLSSGIK